MKKPRKSNIGKTPVKTDKRLFPRYTKGMSTEAYVNAYHAANAGVHLTEVTYIGGNV